MTIKTILTSALLAATMIATGSQAQAESSFSTLAGIAAEPMSAAEMEATQGRFFVDPLSGNLWDYFGNVFVYDPANNVYVDQDGNSYKLGYLGADDQPYDPGLNILIDESGQSGVLAFNMFGTAILPDGSVVDALGNLVGTFNPGS